MTDAGAAALGRLMLAFDGLELPEPMRRRLAGAPAAGISLFRFRNVASLAQVRALVDAVQALAPVDRPFLVAIDQEGGQLRGLGPESTPFPGAMALGAAGDVGLTRRVGSAVGLELRAAGVNVNYAPVADLATNPRNPSLGIRSFGSDASAVAGHVAAFVEGLESVGVAATLKHFPGKGDAGVDTHHELARVERTLDELGERELRPFRAGMGAGASLVMSGHFAIPSLTGDRPATLTPAVMRGLLRDELGFGGVSISDAFDMDALSAGEGRVRDAIDGLNGGLDLLLLGGRSDGAAFDQAVLAASADGTLSAERSAEALGRIGDLRRRLGAGGLPALADWDAHRTLAREVAERAVTLVRDRDGLLPLRLASTDRVLVITPRPEDLTPADTSSGERVGLAAAVARRHQGIEALAVAHAPSPGETRAAGAAARDADIVIIGSVSASLEPLQAELVRAVLDVGRPTITAALRTPWDLAAYPAAGTHLCTYSILEPSCEALAAVLFGELAPTGRLPVAVE
ncbi:MAG TPA: glycoside hydrolase family 3 N-terminal domain-containing protein [Candidatus Limnocylindria bacterium]|nr:glycoside hydrolase family 3 N-terminal domain-containing protein [Candidatus Limnocylindria bacterium]